MYTVPVTDLPQRNSTSLPPGLERRLFLSFFFVFAIVLVGFALAIHVWFVNSLKSQTSARVGTLLVAGLRSVHIRDGHFAVKENVPEAALLTAGQGLQWFDVTGKIVADEGLVPTQQLTRSGEDSFFPAHGGRILRVRTGAIVTATGTLLGWVRAAQDVTDTRAQAWRLDVILIIGGVLSLLASMLGARFLQLRSVEPIRGAYERLREFSADASHELRGPITAIKSNADAALRDAIGMRGTDHERFSSISQAAQQMSGLTNDLLLLAGSEEPMDRDLFAVDLGASIENVLRLYRSEFDARNITLTTNLKNGITVYGNPDQLERIFANLVQNALRYTPPGGEVRIEEARRRDSVSVHIRDTGAGIPRDQLEKIFERFWRGESARTRSTGTGLGLAIVRALVKRHGGDISVESEPGAGSDFIVTLPFHPPV
jgi:signal transduction histidine kinase